MPDDVQVDQPRKELSCARRSWTVDAWLRWFWLWDTYFAVGYVALVGFTLAEADTTPTAKAVTVALLSLMAVWYVVFGRKVITSDDGQPGRGRVFAGGLVALLTAAVLAEPAASFALFAVCPLIFMSLRLGEAIAAAVAVNLLPALTVLLDDGLGEVFAAVGPTTLLTIAFAVLLGTWIHRIVVQSEERAALIAELEASREEVSRLSRDAGVSAERARLATEIHDTLAQGFASLLTLIQATESEMDSDRERARQHLRLAARTARENLSEARALVAGLTPAALGTASLDNAIRRQVERLAEESGIHASYRVDGDLHELPTATEVVLLRAVQESLTNASKHSGAGSVSVLLRVNESSVSLQVSDDGGGFEPETTNNGFGLQGMRSRAEQVNGSLSVHSGKQGTTVRLEVPR